MTGRPSTYSQEIADEVCRRLAGGESLRAICRDEGIPDESTVRLWALDDREGFAAQYARAREVQFLAIADELLEIADDGRNDWMEREGKDERGGCELNGEHIQRSRVRIDTRKWMLSKMLPKVYGDKTEVAVTGANGGPVHTVSATVEIPANDPIEAARVYQKLMSGDG
jgi:Bacteriophage Sf6, terminase small subunit-like